VLRVFFDAADRTELPGSPVRLDAERHEVLQQICRGGSHGRARLGPLEGTVATGWALGAEPVQLRVDHGDPLTIEPPQPPPASIGPSVCRCPPTSAMATPITSSSKTAAGERLDESFELVPFQLTPWGALQEHGRPPFPDQTLTAGAGALPQPPHPG